MMSSLYRSALGCSALSALLLALVPLSACSDSSGPTTDDADGAEVTQFPNSPDTPGGAAGSGAEAPGAEPAAPSSTPNGEGTPQVEGLAPAPVDGAGQTTPAEVPTTTPPTDMPPTDMPTDMETPPATPPGEQNSPTPITPSAGCGKGAPPTGQLALTIRGNRADYLVTLPPNYSTTTPSPLIFGFHGRNRTFLEFQQVDASQIQTTMGARAVMVYPQSQGGAGWNAAAEVPPSVEFFDALYTQLTENYCVDTSHVFAVGHSSGGYFSDILACRYGDRLRGIGDVSGAIQERACNGNVAALLVHGPNDTVVPFAGAVAMRDFYVQRNGCTQTTTPGPVSPCVTYQGCEAGLPVSFCQHNEPTYSDGNGPTNHGWPSFASQAITNFLFALP